MSDICIGLCTCPDKAVAMSIAERLVELKLAACVNIIEGVSSVYRWQGKIQCDQEVQMIVKTEYKKVAEVYDAIARLHPYDTPEWLVLDASGGSQNYLDWIKSCLK